MTIQDLTQPEALALIDANEENRRLRFPSTSPISIFRYELLAHNTDRECSMSLDTSGTIRAIAMYRYRTAEENLHSKEDYTLISLGVDKTLRGQGIGTELLNHVLTMMKQRVKMVTLQISPDEPAYRERWSKFLYERFQTHGLELRDRLF